MALSTLQHWVRHAEGRRLERVDFSDHRGGRRTRQATDERIEERVIELRRHLREKSDLGEFGAAAIHREMTARRKQLRISHVPSLRTIGRILERRGALDGRRRRRWPAPPRGWYLPELRNRRAELDSFDIVEGLVIQGGTPVEVLNGISLHGGLCMSRVAGGWTAKKTVETLIEHWQEQGLPDYAQFDNDTVFQGAHQWPDSFGRVTRLCLQLDVIPVFVPPRETGFQAGIESYNGRWQAKVWSRFTHACRPELARRSDRYVAASQRRSAARIESAPPRWQFPHNWQLDLAKPLSGTVIFLRRTNDKGHVHLLGHDIEISPNWCHRLVRCHVELTAGRIRVYRLRRREPTKQPLMKSIPYEVPDKRFQGGR